MLSYRHMKNILILGALLLVILVAAATSTVNASATITSVVINGSISNQVQVDPGDNITVSLTATLTDGTKWKGTNWGINNFGITSTCVNSKNAKEGTQNVRDGVYTETFVIKAPAQPGLYDVNFLLDGKNNCGQPIGSVVTSSQRIKVGTDTEPPVIAPHSDVQVTSETPVAVNYTIPVAIDDLDPSVLVTCSPSSGSVFPIGDTTITCNASDSAGNAATPTTFVVSVVPPLPPPDTEAPVIAAHENISVSGTPGGQVVNYINPIATDNLDATTTVGTTTVTCNAEDAAGNQAIPTTFEVGVYVGAVSLIYEYWPTENAEGGSGLTFSSINGTIYNPVISVTFDSVTQIHSVCLAIDSYNAIDPNVKLGIYAMSAPNTVGALLASSDPYPFAGQYVDWFINGDETCTTFPSPATLSANTQYAIGVDRTLNSTSNEDINWYNRDAINDPNVWSGSASSFPGSVIPTDDKPYVRIYGIQ
jgi:hypothetical protein